MTKIDGSLSRWKLSRIERHCRCLGVRSRCNAARVQRLKQVSAGVTLNTKERKMSRNTAIQRTLWLLIIGAVLAASLQACGSAISTESTCVPPNLTSCEIDGADAVNSFAATNPGFSIPNIPSNAINQGINIVILP